MNIMVYSITKRCRNDSILLNILKMMETNENFFIIPCRFFFSCKPVKEPIFVSFNGVNSLKWLDKNIKFTVGCH